MTEELTEQQAQEILRDFNESKSNLHSFFIKIIQTPDTAKTGNLTAEELGISNLPVRTYKELALFSKDIADQKEWGEFFDKMSEIQTSTSLSKEGFLINKSVTKKNELSDVTPRRKNSGWFKSNKEDKEG